VCSSDLAKVFERNVHIGQPTYQGELNDLVNEPKFSTVTGLLDYSLEQIITGTSRKTRRKKGATVIQKAVNWLRDFF
jgi:cell division protein FtsA